MLFIFKVYYILNSLFNTYNLVGYDCDLIYYKKYKKIIFNPFILNCIKLKLNQINFNINNYLNQNYSHQLKFYINIFYIFKILNVRHYLKINTKPYSNYKLYNIIVKLSIDNLAQSNNYWYLNNNKSLNSTKLILNNKSIIIYRVALLDLILKKYLEKTLSSKIFLNFDKYNIMFYKIKNSCFYYFKKKLKRMKRVLKDNKITLKTFINIFMIFIYTKDINLIYRVLTDTIQSMSFKNHKRFLYYLKLFITRTLIKYYRFSKFLGFYFYISGKISCTGNSKTRKYIISYRKHSFSNKTLKINLKKGLIYTKTGVLGFTLITSYK